MRHFADRLRPAYAKAKDRERKAIAIKAFYRMLPYLMTPFAVLVDWVFSTQVRNHDMGFVWDEEAKWVIILLDMAMSGMSYLQALHLLYNGTLVVDAQQGKAQIARSQQSLAPGCKEDKEEMARTPRQHITDAFVDTDRNVSFYGNFADASLVTSRNKTGQSVASLIRNICYRGKVRSPPPLNCEIQGKPCQWNQTYCTTFDPDSYTSFFPKERGITQYWGTSRKNFITHEADLMKAWMTDADTSFIDNYTYHPSMMSYYLYLATRPTVCGTTLRDVVAVPRQVNDNSKQVLQDSLRYLACILKEGEIQNDVFETFRTEATLRIRPKTPIPLGSKAELFESLELSPPYHKTEYWPQVADIQQFLHDNPDNQEQTYRILGGDTNTSLSLLDNFYVANAWLEHLPVDKGFETHYNNEKMQERSNMPWDEFESQMLDPDRQNEDLLQDPWRATVNDDTRKMTYLRQFLPCFPVTNTAIQEDAPAKCIERDPEGKVKRSRISDFGYESVFHHEHTWHNQLY